MRTFATAMVMLATLGLAVAASAREVQKSDVASLEAARDTVAWEAQNTKGTPRHELKVEEQRLQNLIDTLKHGGTVDPAEVDRALHRAR